MSTPAAIVDGELNIQQAAQQCERLRGWLAQGVTALDLSQVGECDSAGVQLLIAVRRAADVKCINASAPVRDVLRRYALDHLLEAQVKADPS